MGKSEKTKINIKDRVDDITIDLSLSDISEVPVNSIVSVSLFSQKTNVRNCDSTFF